MYGDLANKLAIEAKRTQQLDTLPVYQEELVRSIVRETNVLQKNADNAQLVDEDSRVTNCQLFVTHLCMRRNKRCMLAYQKMRAERLASWCWEGRTVETSNLSASEQEYYKKYTQLLTQYKGPLTDIDLTGSLEPPKDVFIDVRVLKDAGEIQTEYGVYNLIKDSQFYVRQADVERLIQQGYLQKL